MLLSLYLSDIIDTVRTTVNTDSDLVETTATECVLRRVW